jgi:3-dehydroquinate dehydratase
MHKTTVEWVFEYIISLHDNSQKWEMRKYISVDTQMMSLNHNCKHKIVIPKNTKIRFIQFCNTWNSNIFKNQKIVTFKIAGLDYEFKVDSEDFKMCTEKDVKSGK